MQLCNCSLNQDQLWRKALLANWPRWERAARAFQINPKTQPGSSALTHPLCWYLLQRITTCPSPLKKAQPTYTDSGLINPATQALHKPRSSRNCPRTTFKQENSYSLEDTAASAVPLKQTAGSLCDRLKKVLASVSRHFLCQALLN